MPVRIYRMYLCLVENTYTFDLASPGVLYFCVLIKRTDLFSFSHLAKRIFSTKGLKYFITDYRYLFRVTIMYDEPYSALAVLQLKLF